MKASPAIQPGRERPETGEEKILAVVNGGARAQADPDDHGIGEEDGVVERVHGEVSR